MTEKEFNEKRNKVAEMLRSFELEAKGDIKNFE